MFIADINPILGFGRVSYNEKMSAKSEAARARRAAVIPMSADSVSFVNSGKSSARQIGKRAGTGALGLMLVACTNPTGPTPPQQPTAIEQLRETITAFGQKLNAIFVESDESPGYSYSAYAKDEHGAYLGSNKLLIDPSGTEIDVDNDGLTDGVKTTRTSTDDLGMSSTDTVATKKTLNGFIEKDNHGSTEFKFVDNGVEYVYTPKEHTPLDPLNWKPRSVAGYVDIFDKTVGKIKTYTDFKVFKSTLASAASITKDAISGAALNAASISANNKAVKSIVRGLR